MDSLQHEQALRKRILAGDASAWQELYQSSFHGLWRGLAARHAWWARDQLEEVVQESWLIAIRRIAQFDPNRAPFRKWLRGIAENVLRNHKRRRWLEVSQRQSLQAIEFYESPALAAGTAVGELRELLALSWGELPEHYRQALGDKYVEEMSVQEMAARRSVSPKAVESLLSRARDAFRTVYSRRTHLEGES